MNETVWFTLALWIALLALSFIFRKPVVTLLASILGIFQGFALYSDGQLMAIIMILVNLYLGYEALENWDLG